MQNFAWASNRMQTLRPVTQMPEGYKGIFQQMMKEFGFKYVVSTLRESFSATHNGWKAMIYNGEEFYTSKRYDIDPIIDRVGGGDSFSGGIIHGLMTKPNQGEALEFAVARVCLETHY